ncbi:MAG: hypothetical protein WCP34_00560 [Pseudomonadota bacterium]
MKIVTSLRRMIPMTFALGLVIGSTVTPVWGAEAAAASTTPTPAAEEKVAWADNRALAVGLGAVGGVLAYSLLCSWWGGGVGGARMVQQAAVMPRAAGAGAGAAIGGSRLMLTASGVAGALVGDWFYRSKRIDSAARK